MFKTYLKIAWRHLINHKFYSIVNIFGLSLGLGFVLLITSYIWGELQVNRDIKSLDRQYLVHSNWKDPNMGIDITTLGAVGSSLRLEYPSLIKNYYRFDGINAIISKGEKHFQESVQAGDSTFLSMFGFPLLYGNASTALNNPNSMVITEAKAQKYFGKKDVVGQVLTLENFAGGRQDYIVTGVLKAVSHNSVTGLLEKESEIFIPMNTVAGRTMGLDWNDPYIVTYVELQMGVNKEDLKKPFQQMLGLHADDKTKKNLELYLTPLKDQYLNPPVKKWLMTLGAVGIFILLMAIVNFVNITIGSSSGRLKEIGIRKVLGGIRKTLVFQFLTESVLLVFFSMILALLFFSLLRSTFSQILGKEIPPLISFPWLFVFIPFIGVLLVGLLAGFYPALVLSSMKSVDSIKGKLKSVKENILLRRSLITFQFVVAIFVFIAALVISRQVSYFFNKDLGYNKESLLTISSLPRDFTKKGVEHLEIVRDELGQLPVVSKSSLSYEIPDGNNGGTEGINRLGTDSNQAVAAKLLLTDEKYASTYQIPLLDGEFFNSINGRYDPLNVVINETAAKSIGYDVPGKAVGNKIRLWGNPLIFNIAGVTKNFHFGSLQETISPIIFINLKNRPNYRFFTLRLKPGNLSNSIALIQKNWSVLMPDQPFEFLFMDERLQQLYQSEIQLRKSSYAATAFSLVVVLLGVLGIVSLSTARRAKEMGIRKVLGASISGFVYLFLKEFALVFVIANLIAWPLSFIAMKNWLQDYSYRISLEWSPFLFVAIILSLTTGLVIVIQTIKTASKSPIKSLRIE
jgi:putative ABC transport system permease protein